MSKVAQHKKKARQFEQREDWKRAIEHYEMALEKGKESGDLDLSLYNRVGDLYRRIGEVNKAIQYYESAVDAHMEAGFYNNAIALCNKILRSTPHRYSIHLKLGKIGAAKGFLSDARKHFLEYAEHMQQAGQLDNAFEALLEFAEISPDPEIRMMIADQLLEHERAELAVEQLRLAWRDFLREGRESDAASVRDRILEMAPERDPEVDPPEADTSTASMDAEGVVDLPELEPYPYAETDAEPAAEVEPVEIVPTSLTDAEEAADPEESEAEADPQVEAEADPQEAEGLPTIAPQEIDGLSEDPDPADEVSLETEAEPEPEAEIAGSEPPDTGVELPAIEDEADTGLEIPEIDEASPPEPESEMETPAAGETPAAAEVPPVEEDVAPEEVAGSEAVAGAEEAVDEVDAAERVAELRLRLESEGPEPALKVDLADALLEIDEREEAILQLREAVDLYERRGDHRDAVRVLEELLYLDRNDVQSYQKRVEVALKAGDRNQLIEAYLDLADCLDRTDADNKARVVYRRVLELDSTNSRALAALEMLGTEETPRRSAGEGQPATREFQDLVALVSEEREAQKSTRFVVPAHEPENEEQVDFSAMLDQFKSKVAENIEQEDASSHYDLGVAFKEMGLLEEAITEFQIASRSAEHRLRALEMLGACFLEKEEHRIALKVLGRALQVPSYTDDDLIGIHYGMGRAHEELGEERQALEYYERVMGCDIHFADVADRVSALRD